jgi:hypothetical protein
MDSDMLIFFSILEAGCLTPCRARITHWLLVFALLLLPNFAKQGDVCVQSGLLTAIRAAYYNTQDS